MERIEPPRRALPLDILIDGVHWPTFFTAERVRSSKSLALRPDDVLICTYPKCGTTWMQHIVHQLLGKADYERIVDDYAEQPSIRALCYTSPMIEQVGAAAIDGFASPRVLKSHLNYFDIPKGGKAKYIYVVRNPKDCLTSYFHHHRNFKHYDFENGDFDLFFDLFMEGEIGCGDYFDHLTSWLEGIAQGEEEILLIKYEDMVADLRAEVIKIATLLGGIAENFVKDRLQLDKIMEASTLQSMKRNQQRWVPDIKHHGEFIRKGGSRDWTNLFSFEHSLRMDERFHQRCAGTVAAEWWNEEMKWNEDPFIPMLLTIDREGDNERSSLSALMSVII